MSTFSSLTLLLFLVLSSSAADTSVTDESTFEREIRKAIQEELDTYALYFNTSFSVGIANDRVNFSVVSGIQNHAKDVTLKENTLIPMGSATKIYTAVAVLQAVERGLVGLDDAAYEVVDPFLLRTNGTTLLDLWKDETINQITIRQLLGMRACLSDYDDAKLQAFVLDPANENVTISPLDFIHTWAPKTFVCRPGEGGSYSSIGYVMLGFVIAGLQNATTWTDVDQRQILPPVLRSELADLTFPLLGPCSAYEHVSHQYAATFNQIEAPGYWNTIEWLDIFDFSCLNGWTMGNLAATTSDTSAALYHLFGKHRAPPLLTPSSLEAMQTFKPLTVGWSVGLQYGLGAMRVNMFPSDEVPSEYTTFVGHPVRLNLRSRSLGMHT